MRRGSALPPEAPRPVQGESGQRADSQEQSKQLEEVKRGSNEESEVVVIKEVPGTKENNTRQALVARLAQAKKEREMAERLTARLMAARQQAEQQQAVGPARVVTSLSRNTQVRVKL